MRILFIVLAAMLMFGVFSSSTYALTATMKGNNESAFGVTGTFDDSNYLYGIGAGTAFTAAQNTSISAQDKNAVYVAGTAADDALIKINFTIPAHSAIQSINFTAWLNASANDPLHLVVYNYTTGDFFPCNSTATSTANTELQCRFTDNARILKLLGGGNNRTITMMPKLHGNSAGNGWFDFAKIDITYSPPPPDAPPQWSANATNMQSPMLYETTNNHGFQINWTDSDNNFANATFQLGSPSGTLTNYTNASTIKTQYVSGDNYTGNARWYINFTQDQFGPVGTYNFTWFGIDTDGAENSSDTVNHIINKAATNISLRLNDTENNRTYNRNDVANFTAKLNVSGKTIYLWSNYTGWVIQSGTQTIYNYTTLTTTGLFFNLTANWTGDENYTGAQRDYLFNVTSLDIRTVEETVSFSESPGRKGNMFRDGAENVNTLDVLGQLKNIFIASPETVSFADASNNLRNVFGPVGELVSFGDILNRILNIFRTQSETMNIYDSGGKLRNVYQAQNELISLNDIGGRVLDFFRANAETITILDSGGKIRNVYLSQSELVSFYDIGGRMASFFRTQSETVSILDAASKGQGGFFFLTVPETISIYDSSSNMQNLYLIQSELLSFSDISNRIRSLFRAQPDTVSAYDSVLGLRSVYNIQSELLNINDIGGRILNLFRSNAETVNVYDSNDRTRSVYQAQNELVGIGDIGGRILNLFRADTETLSIVDSGIKIRYAFKEQSDLISVYFASSSIKNLFRANGDTLTITDSGGRIRYLIRISQDHVSVFDDEMRLRGVYLIQTELLSFSDIASRILSLFRAQGETINIQDIASKSGGVQNILRSILENIGFTENSTLNQVLFRSNPEIISLNDIADRIRSLFRVQPDTINVIDSGGKLRSVYFAQNERMSLNDIGGRIANLFRASRDTISAVDISVRILDFFRAQPETINIGDSTGKLRNIYQAQNELVGVGDIGSISKNLFRIGSDLINLNDVSSRILGLFRASPETININDSISKARNVFFSQSELVNLYDSYGKARNVYLSQNELLSFNDFASRILNLFRLAFENINVYDYSGKARSVNITSLTAQASLYQNQYQTFDLTLNNTGEENVSVDYNITVYNSAGSAVSVVQCPAATCPYNLAVGQTLISTTSWFTGSNAVGSYVAQAVAFFAGANVSKNVSFSIIATPSQPSPSPSGGGGSSAITAPVVQQILPLEKIGVEFSGFTVLREITAGEAFAAGVRVKNSFGEPRRISVFINGLPSSWVTITPEEQTIKANSEAVANILIATPVNIVPADYRVEMEVSAGGQTASKTFFILRVKNAPDILNVRPVVNREIKIDKATNQTEVSIFVRNGNNPVQLTRVTERIPKSLAQSVSDVSFELEPSKVLENDPVVQWDIVFNPGEEDTKIIKYRVKKILDDYSQYVYWNLEQMSVYPYLAGALPFSFKSSANTLAKNQFNPVIIELANDGNASFDATLSFETPEGWVIIPKEVSRNVKPGESGRFPFEIKPEIASDGPYTLTLKAVLDRKTYTQQLDFYVTSFKPEQLILPAIVALTAVLAAYAIVRARTRRSRPRFSHMLDVIRDR